MTIQTNPILIDFEVWLKKNHNQTILSLFEAGAKEYFTNVRDNRGDYIQTVDIRIGFLDHQCLYDLPEQSCVIEVLEEYEKETGCNISTLIEAFDEDVILEHLLDNCVEEIVEFANER